MLLYEDTKKTDLLYSTDDLSIMNELISFINDDNISIMPNLITSRFTSKAYLNLIYNYNYTIDMDENCYL